MTSSRTARIVRKTKETSIEVSVNLDGTGQSEIATPIGFLSHMLDVIARHGQIDVVVKATGPLLLPLGFKADHQFIDRRIELPEVL